MMSTSAQGNSAAFEVLYEREAAKRLDRLRGKSYERVQAAIDSLAANPRPPGVVRLEDDIYRKRVGRWRIIYQVVEEEKVVLIVRIRLRNERTYKNY